MSNILTTIVLKRTGSDPELTTNQQTGAKYVARFWIVMAEQNFSKEAEHALPFTCFFNGGQGKADQCQGTYTLPASSVTLIPKNLCGTNKENPNEQIHDRSLEVNVSSWSYTPKQTKEEGLSPAAPGAMQGQAAQHATGTELSASAECCPATAGLPSHIHNSRITNSQQALLISRALQTFLPMYHRSLCHLVTKERFHIEELQEKNISQFLFCFRKEKDEIKRIVIF